MTRPGFMKCEPRLPEKWRDYLATHHKAGYPNSPKHQWAFRNFVRACFPDHVDTTDPEVRDQLEAWWVLTQLPRDGVWQVLVDGTGTRCGGGRLTTAVMFSKASDEWSTPQDTFDALDAEFRFVIDCAATAENTKCARWLGPGGVSPDALTVNWGEAGSVCWLNPPYSRVRAFVRKAAAEAAWHGCTVVLLLPARTDTRWFHDYVWDQTRHAAQPGVELRFLRGRLKFGGATSGAPFPSLVVIFHPTASEFVLR